MREAMWYEKLPDNKVVCQLCPHECCLGEGKSGICRVRSNRAGKLYTKNYGLCTSLTIDPIEKKPLYHFYPGKNILSLGTVGCNFNCVFCQNWHLAHGGPSLTIMEPKEVIEVALGEQEQGCIGIAYTYSEPTVWYEFVLDSCRLAKEAGLKNVLVTNGYIGEKPFQELAPYLDALNIDVKGFSNSFYRQYIKGDYKPVLKTAERALKFGCHVEITNLLVTGLNDSKEEVASLVEWCATNLGKDVPLHFSRYFPNYRLDAPPTPLATLEEAYELAVKKLNYVYLGNVPHLEKSHTYCPGCGEVVIYRTSYHIQIKGLTGDSCTFCGEKIPLIGL